MLNYKKYNGAKNTAHLKKSIYQWVDKYTVKAVVSNFTRLFPVFQIGNHDFSRNIIY